MKSNKIIQLIIVCTLGSMLGQAQTLQAKLHMPSIFTDHMVLQQNAMVPLKGETSPNESVVVETSWGVKESVRADNKGYWAVGVKTPGAVNGKQPGYRIKIMSQGETIELKDVLIGDVWICSGQSNMEMILDSISKGYRGVNNHKMVLSQASNPLIRLFKADRSWAEQPALDVKGKWLPCEPEPARWYSAVGYFFASNLVGKLDYPIGLVNLSWGGAACQSFIGSDALEKDSVLKSYVFHDYGEEDLKNNPHYLPARLYNGMVHPVVGFPIKGAIWYQGEANRINYYHYSRMLSTMIQQWRREWGQGDFPFYLVEIAPYLYEANSTGDTPGNHSAALLREQQRMVLSLPNTGIASTIDIGEPFDIHPKNKQDVGKRLALLALKNTYKFDVVDQAPYYNSFTIESNKIRIHFKSENKDAKLVLKNQLPTGFLIAGEDRVFYPAKAVVKGKWVLVHHPLVSKPVAVRYGFSDAPVATLFERGGLPVPAFRTDNWAHATFNMDDQTGCLIEKHFSTSFTKTVSANFLLYLPVGFDPSKTYPLMVFLHGSGERGDNPNQIKVHGIPKAIVEGAQPDFILVAPQCKTGVDWQSENLFHLIKGIMNSYPVDSNRVYLTGMSMGGTATWDLAFDYPELFAAIAPVCGRINRNHPREKSSA